MSFGEIKAWQAGGAFQSSPLPAKSAMKAIRTKALKIKDGNILALLPKLSGQAFDRISPFSPGALNRG
jgi:hypothetical protein